MWHKNDLRPKVKATGSAKNGENGNSGILFTIADISKTVTIRVMKLGPYHVSIETFSKHANKDDLETRSRSQLQTPYD